MISNNWSRRDFIKSGIAGAAAIGTAGSSWAAENSTFPTRPLGKTGERVSILGVGGHHMGRVADEQEAIELVRAAIDNGVTFLDNAWEYHDGRAEELMGKALRDGYRERAFLMTKHHGRDKATAMKHLEDSLRRLQTDVIDLWQFHEIVYPRDPEMIFAVGGGIEAADEAKKQGKVRYIGFTGHKDPAIFKDMLAHDYAWDAVQMPINVMDAHFMSFRDEILPTLEERGIGVIAMKTLGSKHVLDANVVTPEEGMVYAWSQPVATIVSGMEKREFLEQNIALARSFTPLSAAEQETLLARTKDAAMTGKFEPFKTTRMYDGPVGRALHGVPAGA